MTVAEVMEPARVLLEPAQSLEEAARRLLAAGASGAPVVDDGRLAGIVTEADLLRHVRGIERPLVIDLLGAVFTVPPPAVLNRRLLDLLATRVDQVMTRQVVTLKPSDQAVDAVERMLDRRLKLVPVVDDDGHVLGVLTRSRLLALIFNGQGRAAGGAL